MTDKSVHAGEAIRYDRCHDTGRCGLCCQTEDTDYGQEQVKIYVSLAQKMNCCPAGEDFHQGDCLGWEGEKVDAYMMASMASGGIDSVPVRRKSVRR